MAARGFLPLVGLKPRISASDAVFTWWGFWGFSTCATSWAFATVVILPVLPDLTADSICFSFFLAISRTSSREKAMALVGAAALRSRSLRLISAADMGGLEPALAGTAGALAPAGLAGALADS